MINTGIDVILPLLQIKDELLFAQKEIIEYQNRKRADPVSRLNEEDSQWHISSERQKDTAQKNRYKLFFGNIVPPITKNLLMNRIENSFGRVVEYCKDPVSPYAFVYFADASGYYAALNQGSILVDGVNVRIEMPRPRKS